MIILNCSASLAEYFACFPDAESARIKTPDYDDSGEDAARLTANLPRHMFNIRLLQWQLDIHRGEKGEEYLICQQVESGFCLCIALRDINSAGQFVSWFFKAWLAEAQSFAGAVINPLSTEQDNELFDTIKAFERSYHWYLRELPQGMALSRQFHEFYQHNFDALTDSVKQDPDYAGQTELVYCQDYLNLTEYTNQHGELICPQEELDLLVLNLGYEMSRENL